MYGWTRKQHRAHVPALAGVLGAIMVLVLAAHADGVEMITPNSAVFTTDWGVFEWVGAESDYYDVWIVQDTTDPVKTKVVHEIVRGDSWRVDLSMLRDGWKCYWGVTPLNEQYPTKWRSFRMHRIPTAPLILSSSHQVGVPSEIRDVTVSYGYTGTAEVSKAIIRCGSVGLCAPYDLQGYETAWDTDAEWVPTGTNTQEEDPELRAVPHAYDATFHVPTPGLWYFHVSAMDGIPNMSLPVTYGPIIIIDPLHVDAGPDLVLTCTQPAGELRASPAGGVPPYTYAWSPGGGVASTTTVREAGSYSVRVTDARGQAATDMVNVAADFSPPIVEAGADQQLGATAASVLLNGSAQGGSPPYQYIWSPNGETAESITVSVPGTYALTVTGANGCSASDSVQVTGTASVGCPGAEKQSDGEAEAILQALQSDVDEAIAGSSVAVKFGLYCGTLTITKPIELLAEPCATLVGTLVIDFGGGAAISTGTGTSCVSCTAGLQAGESIETLIDGLTVRGSVVIRNAAKVSLRAVAVRGSAGNGVSVTNSSVEISDSTITGSAGAGIYATEGSSVALCGNTLADNAAGSVVASASTIENSSASQPTEGLPADATAGTPLAGSADALGSSTSSCPELVLSTMLEREVLGEPFESTASAPVLIVRLSSRANVVVAASFSEEWGTTCSKQAFAGTLDAGDHAIDLRPALGDFIRPEGGEVLFETTATRDGSCLARSTCTGRADAASRELWDDLFGPSRPTAPGERIDMKSGGSSITINGTEAYYVTHGYAVDDSFCQSATCADADFTLYVDGVKAQSRAYSPPVLSNGIRIGRICHWLTELPPNSLTAGEHVFRGVWTYRSSPESNFEREVIVTVEYPS